MKGLKPCPCITPDGAGAGNGAVTSTRGAEIVPCVVAQVLEVESGVSTLYLPSFGGDFGAADVNVGSAVLFVTTLGGVVLVGLSTLYVPNFGGDVRAADPRVASAVAGTLEAVVGKGVLTLGVHCLGGNVEAVVDGADPEVLEISTKGTIGARRGAAMFVC